MQKVIFSLVLIAISFLRAEAQDSTLLKMLDDSMAGKPSWERTAGTFKATQIVNMPTVEAPERRGLQFLIMHRFGKLNEGAYALFGLDNATIRFGLDYGLTDRLSVGVGRSSFDKTYDGNLKWKLLRQAAGKWPVTVSLYGLVTHYTLKMPEKPFLNARYRTAYTSQLLIARKFSPSLSLQVAPALIHFNLVPTATDKNDVFALGMGGRMKITRRISITGEYNLLPRGQLVTGSLDNSLSLGLDIETGGHVFQLVFTNSEGMAGPFYLAKTNGEWGDGDIFFGFNISRAFSFKKDR